MSGRVDRFAFRDFNGYCAQYVELKTMETEGCAQFLYGYSSVSTSLIAWIIFLRGTPAITRTIGALRKAVRTS